MITIAFAIAVAVAVGPPTSRPIQDVCKLGAPISKCPTLVDFCADLLHLDKANLVVVLPDSDEEQTLFALARATKEDGDFDRRWPKVWLAGSEDQLLLCIPGKCEPRTLAYQFLREHGVWKLHNYKGSECL